MIDPIIFSFKLFNLQIVLRWYGVLVMTGAVIGAAWAEKEIKRRGENGEVIWDAMVWVLPIGIIGARLWYVLNHIFSGSTHYLDNPLHILYVWEGGLHFFGGLLFGAVTLIYFLQQNGYDFWLFLDTLAPATLMGQAIARPANFINQELYGQPTTLPWGISIDAAHRIAPYIDLAKFPVETTRFHPTFAYEMLSNFLVVFLLWWLSRRYEKQLKPGALLGFWLLLAGLSRTWIEFFRPDQTRIGTTVVSYTMAVSLFMVIAGMIFLLIRFGKLQPAFAHGWEDTYHIKKTPKPAGLKPELERVASLESAAASSALSAQASAAKTAVKTPSNKKSAIKKPMVKKLAGKNTKTSKASKSAAKIPAAVKKTTTKSTQSAAQKATVGKPSAPKKASK